MSVRSMVYGMAAGAAGTAVLNAATYADMAIRARPPSKLPEKMVSKLADLAGAPQPEGHRERGLGALLGYADGFSAGAFYGLVRPAMPGVPWYAAGLGLAAFTMLLSEGTATALGETNPENWKLSGWLADIVPRCLYGWVTALTYEQMAAEG